MRALCRGRLFAAASGAQGLAALLLLAACTGDRLAGGDDFPNSVTTLGRVAVEESAEPDDWNAWKRAPATPPGVYDSTRVPDAVPDGGGAVLALAAAGDILGQLGAVAPWLDISGALRTVDTLAPEPGSGARRTVRVQSSDAFTARDTTWSLPGAGGAEVLRVSGRLDLAEGGHRAFAFEDDDGDGVLAARPGRPNIAKIRLETAAAGRVEETFLRVAAGADLNFGARGDNALLELRVVVRAGADTLLSRVLRPADGGMAIYDPLSDSSRVEVEERKRLEDGSLEELFYESVVFADSARNYPARFRSVLTTGAGRLETTLLGRDSLAPFAFGDTGRVRKVFESSAAEDTLELSETVYHAMLGGSARSFSDNRLLRVERRRFFRHGDRSETLYRLDLDPPVPDGGEPAGPGALGMRIDFRQGGWIVFEGAASGRGYVGTWVNHQGRKGAAVFDSLGGYVATR